VLSDALHFLDSPEEMRFDVVFVDPPYGRGLVDEVLARLPAALARGAAVYVESDARVAPAPPWRVRRHGRAGAVHYHLIEWGGHDHGSLSGDV
jgi:16S rRNA G966 N2-methylase RsmD